MRRKIFIALSVLALSFNLYTLSAETFKNVKLRKRIPYTFLGDRFRGIDALTQKAPFLGYYTDKNIDKDNRAAMQFAQAQFVLAPSILELNNTDHEYLIFDCSTPNVAMAKIQEIGAKALKVNTYGIILAHRPNQSTTIEGNPQKTFDPKAQKPRL